MNITRRPDLVALAVANPAGRPGPLLYAGEPLAETFAAQRDQDGTIRVRTWPRARLLRHGRAWFLEVRLGPRSRPIPGYPLHDALGAPITDLNAAGTCAHRQVATLREHAAFGGWADERLARVGARS